MRYFTSRRRSTTCGYVFAVSAIGQNAPFSSSDNSIIGCNRIGGIPVVRERSMVEDNNFQCCHIEAAKRNVKLILSVGARLPVDLSLHKVHTDMFSRRSYTSHKFVVFDHSGKLICLKGFLIGSVYRPQTINLIFVLLSWQN
jgi:hypothetical protein